MLSVFRSKKVIFIQECMGPCRLMEPYKDVCRLSKQTSQAILAGDNNNNNNEEKCETQGMRRETSSECVALLCCC